MRISDWSSDVCSSDLPDAGGIRAGLGFGQGEAGNHLAAGQFGEPGLLLLRRTVDQDALAADADIGAEHAAEGRRGPAQLDAPLDLFRKGKAETAVFLRDRQATKAHTGKFAEGFIGGAVVVDDPQEGK